MAYCVDALMYTVQPAALHSSPHRIPAHAGNAQLTNMHNTVLALCDRPDDLVTGAFCVHMTQKAPGSVDSPPWKPSRDGYFAPDRDLGALGDRRRI